MSILMPHFGSLPAATKTVTAVMSSNDGTSQFIKKLTQLRIISIKSFILGSRRAVPRNVISVILLLTDSFVISF